MARWTNDVYNAANHRVKFINEERISVPFFNEPSFKTLITSFTPNDPDQKPLYQDITYGAWICERLTHLPEYQGITN
jgi:isopenicillin-N synthase